MEKNGANGSNSKSSMGRIQSEDELDLLYMTFHNFFLFQNTPKLNPNSWL
jgi:hypothetical protein